MDRFRREGDNVSHALKNHQPKSAHISHDLLDALFDKTSNTRSSGQQLKQVQEELNEERRRQYLASNELNPEVQEQLLHSHAGGSQSRDNRNCIIRREVEAMVKEEARLGERFLNERAFLRRMRVESELHDADVLATASSKVSKRRRTETASLAASEDSNQLRQRKHFEAFAADESFRHRMSSCVMCIDSEICQKLRRECFISHSDSVYLASMTQKDLLIPYHSSLCSLDHVPNSVMLQDETLEHIRNYKKNARAFFKGLDSDFFLDCGYTKGPYKPVFIEWHIPRRDETQWKQISTKLLQQGAHFTIDVIPLNENDYEEAKLIVAQELRQSLDDINRLNRSFKTYQPSPKRGPKDIVPETTIPYIYIDFGLSQAYIHTLEDRSLRGSLIDKIDRRYMRSLIQSFIPEEVDKSKIAWTDYLTEYKTKFAAVDWTKAPL